jgi:hypothetical protein
MKFLSSTTATALFLLASLSMTSDALEVGDNICVEGFIMDFFCINRGTLLDRSSVRTLEGPELHSVKCLVDVPSCVSSPFEVLLDPAEAGGLYSRGWRMAENSKQTVVDVAREVGSCGSCNGGSFREGFRAALNATILNLNEGTGVPPIIQVHNAVHSNDLEDPCSLFEKEDILDVIANKTDGNGTGFEFGGITSSGGNLQQQHFIHGSLMLIGWGFLLPSGTLFAKFFKHRPDGLWFQIHRGCQTVGLLLALAGWIFALNNFNVFADKGFNNYRHGILGTVTMVLGLLQPINACLRPHPPKEGEEATSARLVWEVGHKSTGYLAILLAVVTIGYGTTLLANPDDQKTFQMAYGIGVGCMLLLIVVALNIDKANYQGPEEHINKKVDEEEQSPLAEPTK